MIDTDLIGGEPPRTRRRMSRDEFTSRFGADERDLTTVERFALSNTLSVLAASPEKRLVELSGAREATASIFGVELEYYQRDGRIYHAPREPAVVPTAIAGVVVAVVG